MQNNLDIILQQISKGQILTTEQVDKFLTLVLTSLSAQKKELDKENKERLFEFKEVMKYIEKEHKDVLKDWEDKLDTKTTEVYNKIKAGFNTEITKAKEIIQELRAIKLRDGVDGKDGEPGKDADETKIVAKVLKKLPKSKDYSAEGIKDMLESLEDDDRLDYGVLKNTPDLSQLANPIMAGAGGRLLSQMNDVDISGVTDNSVLIWDEERSIWKIGTTSAGSGTVTSVATGTGLTGGPITTTGTVALSTPLQPIASLTGNAGKYLRVNAGESAVEYATASGAGTVTSVSVVTANGISGTVANPTTTPAITLDISGLDATKLADGSVTNAEFQYLNGLTSAIQTQLDAKVDENSAITGATKTKITYDAKGLVTGGADATTADIIDSLNKRYVTDAQLTVIGNTSGTNTGDQTITLTGDVTGTGTGTFATTIKNDVALGGSPTTTTQSAGDNTTKIATTAFVTTAVANGTIGLLDYRGSYDASSNLFPATGGSGIAGAILKGDFYIVSVAGTLGGVSVTPGDLVISVVDTPGQTSTNWNLIEYNLGTYVTAVTGTTNRITSSGGATPSIDISATFEALLGKVASPLSQFAATTSLQLAGVISDETGSGALVFGTSPTLSAPVIATIVNTGTLTLPTATDTLVGRATTDTLTNKTLNLTSNTLVATLAQLNSAVSDADLVSLAGTETLTNKRPQPRTASSTTASTLTPDLSSANVYYRTTQTASLTINAPTGTPVIGETIAIYVDSAGAQTLTMDSTYKAFGAAFPATTTAGKTLMITAQFNGTDWKTLWANAV